MLSKNTRNIAFTGVLVFIAAIAHAQDAVSDITAAPATQDNANETAQAKAARFSVWEYRVVGNSLLQKVSIEKALSVYLGPDKDAGIINDAADALERLYRDNGFPAVFIDIPEQNVIAGVVRLEVNEGKISRLRVTGSHYFTLSGLIEKVPSLRTGQTIHLPTVQVDIQKLHSYSSDLQAVPILKAGKEPGTMEIELRVKDELPLHGSLEVNNHYSANTTKSRLEASVGYDNLWQKFHSFRLTAQTTPENTEEVRVLVANYIMPVNDASNRLAMYAVKSNSDIAAVGGLSVLGKGKIIGARYVIPLDSSSGLTQSTSLGLDYKDVEDIVNIKDLPALKTPIEYVVAGATYSATAYDADSSVSYTAGINLGVRGPNSGNEFENKRFKARPDFIYFRGDIARTDRFVNDSRIESRVRLQLTDYPLISNEQFTAGGFLTVRGYLESQVLGDNGIAGGIELYTPKLFYSDDSVLQTRLLSFIEGASVKTLDPLPGQDRHAQLISAGLGVRVTKSKQLSLKIDWAYPLYDAGDAGSGTLIKKGDSQLVASFGYTF